MTTAASVTDAIRMHATTRTRRPRLIGTPPPPNTEYADRRRSAYARAGQRIAPRRSTYQGRIGREPVGVVKICFRRVSLVQGEPGKTDLSPRSPAAAEHGRPSLLQRLLGGEGGDAR